MTPESLKAGKALIEKLRRLESAIERWQAPRDDDDILSPMAYEQTQKIAVDDIKRQLEAGNAEFAAL